MKVILTDNLPKLGEVGDICDVADGYARNYLLPQGFAMLATQGALKQVDNLKRQETRRRARLRGDAEAQKAILSELTLTFQAKIGETGRLYGSITNSDIAQRIEELTEQEIDRRKIVLDNPLRQIGTYQIPIRLLPDVVAEITVNVDSEEEVELPDDVREALEEEGILVSTVEDGEDTAAELSQEDTAE